MRANDWHVLMIVAVLAAVAPLMASTPKSPSLPDFPGWPTHFEGRALRSLPLTEPEQRFERTFPGRIGRFTDGSRELVIRWVTKPTRMLHPAADCFRGSGYAIEPRPLERHEDSSWSAFDATKGTMRFRVRERITGANGDQWSDVSAWYWSASRSAVDGPWWATTVADAYSGSFAAGVPLSAAE